MSFKIKVTFLKRVKKIMKCYKKIQRIESFKKDDDMNQDSIRDFLQYKFLNAKV